MLERLASDTGRRHIRGLWPEESVTTRYEESHGVEGHPPDESLRWDETPIVAVRPASLQLPIDTEITTNRHAYVLISGNNSMEKKYKRFGKSSLGSYKRHVIM